MFAPGRWGCRALCTKVPVDGAGAGPVGAEPAAGVAGRPLGQGARPAAADRWPWPNLLLPGPQFPPFPNGVIEHTLLELSHGSWESVARPGPPGRQWSPALPLLFLFPIHSSPYSPWRTPLCLSWLKEGFQRDRGVSTREEGPNDPRDTLILEMRKASPGSLCLSQ